MICVLDVSIMCFQSKIRFVLKHGGWRQAASWSDSNLPRAVTPLTTRVFFNSDGAGRHMRQQLAGAGGWSRRRRLRCRDATSSTNSWKSCPVRWGRCKAAAGGKSGTIRGCPRAGLRAQRGWLPRPSCAAGARDMRGKLAAVRGSGSTRDSQLRAVLAADVVVSVGSLLKSGLRPARRTRVSRDRENLS